MDAPSQGGDVIATLPDLYLDQAQVTRCRELAARVFQGVYDFIAAHSTVSIERTVLRLFGVSGAGPRGVPLCNLMVDRLKEAGVLGKGVAYWYGRALRERPASSPLEMIERLPALLKSQPLTESEDQRLREEIRREATEAAAELRKQVEVRRSLQSELGTSPPPLKYVIVATGNIYDDVEQAKAAAQAGADIIAVIRSTAQSLLDYVPHGATLEG